MAGRTKELHRVKVLDLNTIEHVQSGVLSDMGIEERDNTTVFVIEANNKALGSRDAVEVLGAIKKVLTEQGHTVVRSHAKLTSALATAKKAE